LAKNSNFFSQLDNYMKELARILSPALQQRLEWALTKEVAIARA
jgi:hypothetical protein